jgi:hypothetical protein
MDFHAAIRLTFYAVVGRDELRLPVIRDVLGGASRQIMLIHVDGTLYDPQMTKQAFPGVAQALQQFQADLQRGPRSRRGQQRQAAPERPWPKKR